MYAEFGIYLFVALPIMLLKLKQVHSLEDGEQISIYYVSQITMQIFICFSYANKCLYCLY